MEMNKKFTMEETRNAMKLAWEIRKNSAWNFNCKITEIDFSKCLKEAYLQIKYKDVKFDFDAWFKFYEANPRAFSYILYHNNVIIKNGKYTISQEMEAATTSTCYQIMEGEEQDIKQETLIRVMERFSKEEGGVIEFRHRFTIYGLAALNAIKSHSRMIKRSRLAIPGNYKTGYNYQDNITEKIVITEDSTSFSDLRLDLQKNLTEDQLKLCQLLEAGYQKQEIAYILGVSRMTVNNRENKIKAIVAEQLAISI